MLGTVLYRRPNLHAVGYAGRSSRSAGAGALPPRRPGPDEARLLEGAPGAAVPSSTVATQALVPGRAKATSEANRASTRGPRPLPISSSSPIRRSTPATPSSVPTIAAPLGVVGDEIRLDHADRPAVELDQIVVRRLAPLDRRQVVGLDLLVRLAVAPPALDVRALQPRVEEDEVVLHHRLERDHARLSREPSERRASSSRTCSSGSRRSTSASPRRELRRGTRPGPGRSGRAQSRADADRPRDRRHDRGGDRDPNRRRRDRTAVDPAEPAAQQDEQRRTSRRGCRRRSRAGSPTTPNR